MAARYATALFELALEQKALDPVNADLERFDAMVADSVDLARLVRSPVFSADEQIKALRKQQAKAEKQQKKKPEDKRRVFVLDFDGVVADSDPEAEFMETVYKSAALFRAAEEAQRSAGKVNR